MGCLSQLLADLSTERFEAEGIEQRLATVVIAAPLVVRGGSCLPPAKCEG